MPWEVLFPPMPELTRYIFSSFATSEGQEESAVLLAPKVTKTHPSKAFSSSAEAGRHKQLSKLISNKTAVHFFI
jgi:hypothetical protein